MRTLRIPAIAVLLGCLFTQQANAQVIGTRGSTPFMGYYSPYPGALYSPFAPAPNVNRSGAGLHPGYIPYGGYTVPYGAYYGYSGGYMMNQYPNPGSMFYPRSGPNPFAGTAYPRRW